MRVLALFLLVALHVQVANAEGFDFEKAKNTGKAPELKYPTFFPGYKALKATSKLDNKYFFDKIGAMAESGENGVKTIKDENGTVILHFVVHESGKGSDSPKVGAQCACNFRGTTIDGAEFDDSFKRPHPTALKDWTGTGWTQALRYMVEGDMWEMYIPADENSKATGKIPAGAGWVFVLKLEKIKGEKQPRAELEKQAQAEL